MSPADSSAGGPWFSGPTRFTLEAGASLHVEDRATLELLNQSIVHLMPGSQLILARKARLSIGEGSQIILHGDARLQGRAKHFRKARRQGRISNVQ